MNKVKVKVPNRVYNRTLDMVNGVREELGLRPLKKLLPGKSRSDNMNPVARTIRHGWKGRGAVNVVDNVVVVHRPEWRDSIVRYSEAANEVLNRIAELADKTDTVEVTR